MNMHMDGAWDKFWIKSQNGTFIALQMKWFGPKKFQILSTGKKVPFWQFFRMGWDGIQRANITKKVHKPPRNHYIEWPVFSDIGLNCESQGEKGRTCKKYKILIGSRVFFFHFIHDLPFSPGHLLESEERFVNLFCNFSPLCAGNVYSA